MIVLVLLQGVVSLLLAVLVVGLLRSHAEILRRLHELGAGVYDPDTADEEAEGVTSAVALTERPEIRTTPGVPEPRALETAGHDVSGTTPSGGAKAIGIVGAPGTTLLAFLSSGCGTCADFWRAFGDGEADEVLGEHTRLVVITKSPEEESQSAVQALAPPNVTTVMSSAAYDDYAVPVSPYFILVDGPTGAVIGEGAAGTWSQVSHLLQQAAADAGLAAAHQLAPSDKPSRLSGAEREARADAELLAAGVAPGHQSLYPERLTDEEE
jgi:hypothetical protein